MSDMLPVDGHRKVWGSHIVSAQSTRPFTITTDALWKKIEFEFGDGVEGPCYCIDVPR
jgi:hypothetical protein